MHARTRIVAAVLSAPVALAVVGGPLAGAAVADRPHEVEGKFRVLAGTLRGVSTTTHGQIVVTTFTEESVDTGEASGRSETTWTCARREGTSTSRCTGVGEFTGTGALLGPADVRLTATCTESGTFPALFVACEGRFRLDGTGALEGVHGQATWQSAGLFGISVAGSSVLQLHDHR
jgi:hypothetical protein